MSDKDNKDKSDFLKYSSVSDVEYITSGDEGDWAQNQQLQEQARIAEQAKQANKPEYDPDFDGVHCIDCDREIPEARLKQHKIRCVSCKSDLERLRKKK